MQESEYMSGYVVPADGLMREIRRLTDLYGESEAVIHAMLSLSGWVVEQVCERSE